MRVVLLLLLAVRSSLQTLPDHPCSASRNNENANGTLCMKQYTGYQPTPAYMKQKPWYQGYPVDSVEECSLLCQPQAECAYVYYNSSAAYCSTYQQFQRMAFISGDSVPSADVVIVKTYTTPADCSLSLSEVAKKAVIQSYPTGGIFRVTMNATLPSNYVVYEGNSPDLTYQFIRFL